MQIVDWIWLKKKNIGCTFVALGSLPFASLAQTPPPKPSPPPDSVTSVQIVNVTSVPVISLTVNGRKDYPVFRQGSFTNDGPVHRLDSKYLAENTATGAVAQSPELKFTPNEHQSVVIIGDFNTDTPPGEFPQPGPPLPKPEKPFPPNVLFLMFPHEKLDGDRVSLRVINGMPGKTLSITTKTGKITIDPGKSEVLPDQPPVCEYKAEADGKPIDFLMKQDGGHIRNAMAIFCLNNGEPVLQRAFENR